MARSVHSRRTATMAALAAELGVSRTTVSNAYNRPDQLSPELRERVLDAARRLGYPGPDPLARSLRTRQAGAVGLLFTEALSYAFRDPAAIGFLEGLAMACGDAGRGLLLVPASMDAQRRKGATVYRAAVDGFVVYSVPDDDPSLAAVLQRPLPVVVCDQPLVEGAGHVGIDDRAAMRSLGVHLVGLGHRRIGVVCMRLGRDRRDGFVDGKRQRATRFPVQRARLTGLAEAFGEVLPDWRAVPVVERFDHMMSSGASGAGELLDRHSRLTAIVCTSDVLALGALREVHRRGLRVPEDLTVTGFDGVPEAERVGLTTVSQPVLEKGRAAGRLLLDRRQLTSRTVMLPTELVVRSTSGPAAR
jgi:DNA-binding LacI/PurR family transcriptional regulator